MSSSERGAGTARVRRLALALTPHGRLLVGEATDAIEFASARADDLVRAFARGSGHGLLALGARELSAVLPPPFGW